MIHCKSRQPFYLVLPQKCSFELTTYVNFSLFGFWLVEYIFFDTTSGSFECVIKSVLNFPSFPLPLNEKNLPTLLVYRCLPLLTSLCHGEGISCSEPAQHVQFSWKNWACWTCAVFGCHSAWETAAEGTSQQIKLLQSGTKYIWFIRFSTLFL